MQKKRLIIKPEGNPEDIQHLQNELKIDRILANLLVQRGITTYDEAKTFFRPSLDHLHDPFLMKDMDKAVERLNAAIKNNEKILVYGDYDVDGTTSVALAYSFLKETYEAVDFYVPDRYKEGYGISKRGIDYASETGASLIIALDCGIKAIEQVNYAKQKNIDFVICDHHTADEQVPDAVAVLDPKRPGCEYPYKELSGCGVGFKFMQAFANRNNYPFRKLVRYLDLLAVSIAADIVPITGENRVLAHYGLKQLNNSPSAGMKALIDISHAGNKTLNITDCVFKIGPRINAAGRIRSAKEAVELLIEKDKTKADLMATEIEKANTERKTLDQSIHYDAIGIIGNSNELKNRKTTVLYNPQWHKGVIGIVASRLIETYYKPTVVLTESNGFANGSARSVKDFDLYAAISSCSHLLENFGGHKYAAGLTLKIENLEAFTECFEAYAQEHLSEEQEIPSVQADAVIDFEQITDKFYRILKQFAPFGPGNMKPVFLTKKVENAGKTSAVGRTGTHLKLDMRDSAGKNLGGIGFSMGDYFKLIKESPFDVCYTLDENFFRNNVTIQAKVKHIELIK
jgi:single-stranded-DNA-specific exonuclease